MNVEIYNPDHLPEEFIRAEIAQAEKEQVEADCLQLMEEMEALQAAERQEEPPQV